MGIIGDVAQRVERLLRMQEAGGSNPPISTMNRISYCVCRISQEKKQREREWDSKPTRAPPVEEK